jgi:hypothetical protein
MAWCKKSPGLQLIDKPGDALAAIRSAKAHLQVGRGLCGISAARFVFEFGSCRVAWTADTTAGLCAAPRHTCRCAEGCAVSCWCCCCKCGVVVVG